MSEGRMYPATVLKINKKSLKLKYNRGMFFVDEIKNIPYERIVPDNSKCVVVYTSTKNGQYKIRVDTTKWTNYHVHPSKTGCYQINGGGPILFENVDGSFNCCN